MKDELERYADRMSEEEARSVWRTIHGRAFRPTRSWRTAWAVGGSLAVATAALLIFVIGRGPDLDVTPPGIRVTPPVIEEPLVGEMELVVDEASVAEDVEPAGETVAPLDADRVSAGAQDVEFRSRDEETARVTKGHPALADRSREPKPAIEALAPTTGLKETEQPERPSQPPRLEIPKGEKKEQPVEETRAPKLAAVSPEKLEESPPSVSIDRDARGAKPAGEERLAVRETPAIEKTPIPVAATAGSAGRGRIRGKITDAETGDPLVYANVIILGARMGAVSRADGTYEILDVPGGTYTVRAMMMGYGDAIREGVRVEARKATVVDLQLAPTVFEDLVPPPRRVLTRGRKALETRPIGDVVIGKKDVTLHGGQIHVRGGRSSEVRYRVDGTQVTELHEYGKRRYPMAHGGEVPPNGEPVDAMFFEHYGVNPFIATEDDNLSTFAIDVDTGSYTVCRRYLNDGNLPPKEAVRVEEFVNFFPHEYEPPRKGDFSIHLEGAPSRFGEDLTLLRVGLQGRVVSERDRKPANLVFVIDTSGSMERENRLGLVKRALTVLLDQMDRRDRVGIVEYGSRASVVLRPTSIAYREDIIAAIEDLRAHGSTYAEEGLREGYEMADRAYDSSTNNRVILCSDGVANVGRTGAGGILETIKQAARRGIYLTAVGFGMGNYNDALMEQLADHGDGHYYYVDEMREARRVFLENLTGTLQTIARDVKVQVEFNPDAVARYRLLGYENRDVADRDFRNDKIDAGEVGSGHQVTALYELRLKERVEDERLATVRLRWEDPETGKVTEIKENFTASDTHRRFDRASWSFRRDAAVAEFAEILRRSYWAREGDLRDVERLLDSLVDHREADRETLELLDLVRQARHAWKDEAYTNEWQDDDRRWDSWEEE